MTTAAIIEEIRHLAWADRLLVIEKAVESLRTVPLADLAQSAALLAEDYRTDAELTAFTQLDQEPFYEAG